MDYELIFWVVGGVAALIILILSPYFAKKGDSQYIYWIADGDWK